mmetsp:Transcript_17797/g.42846  ORF Transcript_17797/g.42846 Transcript_17797/m.42846 type:complete len:162 (+) Transcript_17797:136-621(+)
MAISRFTMGSMVSTETLFWTPLVMDLLLMVTTYSYCRLSGLEWYLKTINEHAPKKNDDDTAAAKKAIDDKSNPIHDVWELAMIAYSAYGCVLPWAAYVCYHDMSHRTSLAWAMTALMSAKLASPAAWKWTHDGQKSKILTIIFFYLPTYGGYAIYNTFLEK